MANKVHCEHCVWLTERTYYSECTHKSNRVVEQNWHSQRKGYAKHPRVLNKNMDCPHFSKKLVSSIKE